MTRFQFKGESPVNLDYASVTKALRWKTLLNRLWSESMEARHPMSKSRFDIERTHTRAASFSPLIRVRERCGPSASCLSCLGEQTGLCLWWWRDQSRGHILRGHAKVAVAHPPAMFCSAARIPGIYIMQWRQQTSVCACVSVGVCLCVLCDPNGCTPTFQSTCVCLSSVYVFTLGFTSSEL